MEAAFYSETLARSDNITLQTQNQNIPFVISRFHREVYENCALLGYYSLTYISGQRIGPILSVQGFLNPEDGT